MSFCILENISMRCLVTSVLVFHGLASHSDCYWHTIRHCCAIRVYPVIVTLDGEFNCSIASVDVTGSPSTKVGLEQLRDNLNYLASLV